MDAIPGRDLLARCLPETQARVTSILRLEREREGEDDCTPLVRPLIELVEQVLARLVLEPLRPWGEELATAVEQEKSGRKAGYSLRVWSKGAEIESAIGFTSQVFQALRKGYRAGDAKVSTLVQVFFTEELRDRVAKPKLGMTLERIRARFRHPLVYGEGAVFSPSDYEDLIKIVLGARSVAAWHASGSDGEAEGVLDLLLRGSRLPTEPPPSSQAVIETVSLDPEGQEVGAKNTAPRAVEVQVGGRLGKYALLGELGRGGMGVVFKGRDSTLDRQVAIKVLQCQDASPVTLARFGREARAVARLQHENIVVVHEVSEHVSQPYLVMEYVEGATLQEWLRGGRSPAEVLDIGRKVALALHYAHDQGVVHRDVKPANIMVQPCGRPVLMDFGLALDTSAQTRLTATGLIMGTPLYMAPEQIENSQNVGVPSDVYSLGVTLYQALCGRAPFEADSPTHLFKKILLDDPPAPSSINPAVQADLEAVVLRCLAKDPAKRYATAAALAADLERCEV